LKGLARKFRREKKQIDTKLEEITSHMLPDEFGLIVMNQKTSKKAIIGYYKSPLKYYRMIYLLVRFMNKQLFLHVLNY